MNKDIMKKLAEQIRKENQGLTIVAPEPVKRDREVDIQSILVSGLGNENALLDNGEIIRNI